MLDALLEIILGTIFKIFTCWTGEVVFFLFTLGKRKPRWNLYTNEDAKKFHYLSEISFWVGFVFWVVVFVILYICLIYS